MSQTNDCNKAWSYHQEETGPARWAQLCKEYAPCAGAFQSPVDINHPEPDERLKPLEFHYGTSQPECIYNGYSWQCEVEGGHSLNIRGRNYRLLQFHFHSPAEHTHEGNAFPLEVHFVHQAEDGQIAVLGVWYREGEAAPFFTRHLDKVMQAPQQTLKTGETNLKSLLPADKSYFYYTGSLTTPPCSEGVGWYFLRQPATASKSQLNALAKLLQGNNRPVMPINGRTMKVFPG